MVSLCGFNLFKQLLAAANFIESGSADILKHAEVLSYNSVNKFIAIPVNSLHKSKPRGPSLVLSWSFCLYFNIGDSELWLFGFHNSKENASHQVLIPQDLKIKQVSSNRKHVVCVTESGSCWRYNVNAQKWINLTPILRSEQSQEGNECTNIEVIKVACGETITGVLTKTGEVFNGPNKLTLPKNIKIVDIACGCSHILFLSDEGHIFSVGEGSRGQLGHGDLTSEEEPRLVSALAGLVVTAVACGGWHSCAITADGDFYTWGWNQSGQLGCFDTGEGCKISVQAVPRVVDFPEENDAVVLKVACGSRHTLVLLGDNSVWGCGWNGYGQLALPLIEKQAEIMTRLLPPPDCCVQDIICGPWNSGLLF